MCEHPLDIAYLYALFFGVGVGQSALGCGECELPHQTRTKVVIGRCLFGGVSSDMDVA